MAQDADKSRDVSWQQRAVDRSLSSARARAVSRSGQILNAASELLEETGGIDFTVQDIVDRSNLSLRSFYKHFGGKDELLLALFEELLQGFIAGLRTEVEAHEDPIERLRAYVIGFYSAALRSPSHGGRALGTYHVRMLEVRKEEFARALAPQIELLGEIIEQGVVAGRFRRDLAPAALTGLVTVTLMSAAQMSVLDVHLTGSLLQTDELWAWVEQAVTAPGAEVRPARTVARKKTAKRTASAPATKRR